MPCAPSGSCVTTAAPTPAVASSEGSRIANLLASSRECMAAEALAKARAFSSGKGCAVVCTTNKPAGPDPAVPSMLLEQASACYTYRSAAECVPESVRIARLQQQTLDEFTSADDPDRRFSMYFRKFIAPCPPDPAWYKNAGEPVLQGKNCPLPNSPFNPVLPG